MKANFLGVVLPLFFFACTSQESTELSSQEKAQIINEVKAVADSIWSKWEALDPEGALLYYSDSPDWASFNSEGTRYNFEAYKKLAASFKSSATAYKWSTTRRDFVFVSTDIVICAWVGKDEASWKSGDKMTCDPHAYTLVFKLIAGQWKLVYSHDSGIPVIHKGGKG